MSAATTILYIVGFSLFFTGKSNLKSFCYQFSIVLDVTFDAGLVIVCAGLIGPAGDRASDLETISFLSRTLRERLIHEKLAEVARATTGPAVMVAALFQGEDPDVLISKAVKRFRCISW